jgi:putative ABC transport system permease protein
MQNLILALRNIGRNRRRSAVTIMAVALSCGGLALFGGYMSWMFRAVEEQTVGSYGHLQIYKQGYYARGAGNPSAYAIADFEKLKAMIQNDPVIAPMLEMVTGQIYFHGLVSAPSRQTSGTFIGLGVFPDEDRYVTEWNPYRITRANKLKANEAIFAGPPELDENDITGGGVGLGLGKILRLNEEADDKPASTQPMPAASDGVDLAFLSAQSGPKDAKADDRTLDLLVSPPAGGMPNASQITVRKLAPRATKETEDALIKMHIRHASELVFPGQPLHVTAIVILLKRSADTEKLATRVQQLIDEHHLDLEFKRWHEIRPFFIRMSEMLGLVFDFVFVLLVTMVAFLIYNTQSAGIMERLGEIGTLRAMGVTRIGLWKMIMLEGLMLGIIGGALGVLIAIAGDLLLQSMDIVYIPPGVTFYAKVEVLVMRDPIVLIKALLGSLACAIVSSALPARKAAKMEIVEALRHS